MLMMIFISKEPIWTFFKYISFLDKYTSNHLQFEMNENGELCFENQGLKIIIDTEDVKVLFVKFGEFINPFNFKSLLSRFPMEKSRWLWKKHGSISMLARLHLLNRPNSVERGLASTPLFIIPGFSLHFPLELSYGYPWFEGSGKIPLGRQREKNLTYLMFWKLVWCVSH